MRSWILLLLIFPHLVWAAPKPDLWRRVELANKAFQNVLLQCPEKVWPGVDWSKNEFLFFSNSQRRAWKISQESAKPVELDLSALPKIAQIRFFQIIEEGSSRTVAVNLDAFGSKSATEPLEVAVHELFHSQGQVGWPGRPSRTGNQIPMLEGPRYFRSELFKSLQTGDLSAATYWWTRWSKNFPQETQESVDTIEGTARYVEFAVRTLSEFGCGVSSAEWTAAVNEWAGSLKLQAGEGLDGEGYKIGALAAARLDIEKAGWKTKMPSGIPTLNLLLENRLLHGFADDLQLKNSIAEQTREANSQIEIYSSPLLAQMKALDMIRIALPEAWMVNPAEFVGEFYPRQDSALTLTLYTAGQSFKNPADKSQFMRWNDAQMGYAREGRSPCPGLTKSVYFTLPASLIKKGAQRFAADFAGFAFNFKGKRVSYEGLDYLCPE